MQQRLFEKELVNGKPETVNAVPKLFLKKKQNYSDVCHLMHKMPNVR
jgi:hypothetical protein